jgi:transcriptional antiterminator RfaH
MWCVVNTLPHQEARAKVNLTRQGYQTWLPTFRKSRRHARRIETVVVPLFPGYLFVELDPTRQIWSPINGTAGVRLSENMRPARVPDRFMESLRQKSNEQGIVALADSGLRPGHKVRLVGGPFVDCIGTLLRLDAKGRVALLLSILGQEVRAKVSAEMITSAA